MSNSQDGSLVFPNPDNLLPHQRVALFESSKRFKVCVWHRRARKTTTAIMELVKQAHLRVGPYWHVFPTYQEAKDAIWRDPNMLFNIIPSQMIAKRNEQDLVVYFKNGSFLQLKGADKPERLRGAGPVGVVLDEFATMKYETWEEIIQPIMRANGGWTWFIGTPKGKNHLFTIYNKSISGDDEWEGWRMKASKSGVIPPDQLEKARETMLPDTYNQEMECEWLEGEGSVFRGLKEILTAQPQQPYVGHYYIMGVDLAKVKDYTVITVYDQGTNQQVYQERFNKLEWPFQKAKIASTARHYNNALIILDATGLGNPIADDLLRDGLSVEPFKITETTKKELIEKLSLWIQQRKIRMLSLKETEFEFDNFSYEILPLGGVRYGAPDGFHDDIVISHALAVSKLQPIYKQVEVKPVTKIRQAYIDRLKSYETTAQNQWAEWYSDEP